MRDRANQIKISERTKRGERSTNVPCMMRLPEAQLDLLKSVAIDETAKTRKPVSWVHIARGAIECCYPLSSKIREDKNDAVANTFKFNATNSMANNMANKINNQNNNLPNKGI